MLTVLRAAGTLAKHSSYVRLALPRRTVSSKTPFDDYLLESDSIKESLKNDPNLEGFFHVDTPQVNPATTNLDTDPADPFGLSEIKWLDDSEESLIRAQMAQQTAIQPDLDRLPVPDSGPVTMSTEDFIRKFQNDSTFTESKQVNTQQHIDLPSSFDPVNFHKYTEFLHANDVAGSAAPRNIRLDEIAATELPLVVVSRFQNPRINLSIEKYIYDQVPNPQQCSSARRLTMYRNSPCVVVGKNQNPYKEVNLRLAAILGVPVLRRFSGGGTVVHDLGNVNFSYITGKNEFDRIGFSTVLNERLNELVGKEFEDRSLPQAALTTNDKGDIVSAVSGRKVSGSAFQISRGRSLHHGTMLLDSDLKQLSQLLRLTPQRRNAISDRATASIPSPVENTGVDRDIFSYSAVNAFVGQHGLLPDAVAPGTFDNLTVFEVDGRSCWVLKLDDVAQLPVAVRETVAQLESWEWMFAKTPKFEVVFQHEGLHVALVVDRGRVVDMETSRAEPALDALVKGVKEGGVLFRGDVIGEYLEGSLRDAFVWNVDCGVVYEAMGIRNTHDERSESCV